MDASALNGIELIAVRESGRRLAFSFAEVMRFHGGHSPGGVALAFRAMQRAFAGSEPERREVAIRTAFGGPGARDGFEAVTRAVSDGRYEVDAALARPELGPERER